MEQSPRAIAYSHGSAIGTFFIQVDRSGRWQVRLADDVLDGGYISAQHALDDLAGGHGSWPGSTDPSTLGLPDEIGDWKPHFPRR